MTAINRVPPRPRAGIAHPVRYGIRRIGPTRTWFKPPLATEGWWQRQITVEAVDVTGTIQTVTVAYADDPQLDEGKVAQFRWQAAERDLRRQLQVAAILHRERRRGLSLHAVMAMYHGDGLEDPDVTGLMLRISGDEVSLLLAAANGG